MIETKSEGKSSRKEKLAKLVEYHQPVFDALGIKDPYFVGKLVWKPAEYNEKYAQFFENELSRKQDIYLEFTNKELEPEDRLRRLYVLRHNPYYDREYIRRYEGDDKFLVPISEFEEVTLKIDRSTDFDIIDPNDDIPISSMSVRDLVAIMTKSPVSRKDWLNELIKSINK